VEKKEGRTLCYIYSISGAVRGRGKVKREAGGEKKGEGEKESFRSLDVGRETKRGGGAIL